MLIYDTKRISNAISRLKKAKAASFVCRSGLADLNKAKETCRIIDTLILPLYYIWEHCCNRRLVDLDFEPHLVRAYEKFVRHPVTNTWNMLLFIQVEPSMKKIFGQWDISQEIIVIYKSFISAYSGKRKQRQEK